ncbi:Viral replication-associated protein, N-terminal [Parasponia andersonii]|uniref:Viral replication-associated protein, N-terminal n=1 Tax=Parasponia andersonii TaxID=3476 RepID=A0A2P5AM27_PARAD|nr:Viral replication-associated protein, N-terminal [Parasponia andersonii]
MAPPNTFRTRNVCFIINNPSFDVSALLRDPVSPDVRYFIWQLEQGKAGTLHIQGYAEFKQRVSGTTFYSFLHEGAENCHIENRRGTREQAYNYCCKEETCMEGPFRFGDWNLQQGRRNNIKALRDTIFNADAYDAMLLEHHCDSLAQYPKFVQFCKSCKRRLISTDTDELLQQLDAPPDPRESVWYSDPNGGTGKSTFAKHLARAGAFYSRGGKTADVA